MGGSADGRALRTADVARESGYSVQQVRDLERLGVLPPAPRAGNGYRAYGPVHVRALRAYRGLAGAAGPVEARRLLAAAWAGTAEEAAAAVGAVHVRLARERAEALRAREALDSVRAEPDGGADGRDAMTITELAGALGVRPSTLRFWEEQGLVAPERVTSLRARRYGPAAVGTARIVAALRAAGHGVPEVREVLAALDGAEGVARARRILDGRLGRIAARSVALLRAGADLAEVVDAVGASS
ncbi:MerR family transcriptional regulator [Streptomyces termitum]|uniref:MerR family transcriptional regulator n=1 Tax=Streptomyces termitum TaxID=67368 RepID=UPI0033AC661E